MKYCMECGSKIEGSNGQPPKFCMNCGTPIGGVKSNARVQDEPNESREENFSFANISSLDCEIIGGDPDAVTFRADENLLGTKQRPDKINRAKGKSLDEYKSEMRSRKVIDAD